MLPVKMSHQTAGDPAGLDLVRDRVAGIRTIDAQHPFQRLGLFFMISDLKELAVPTRLTQFRQKTESPRPKAKRTRANSNSQINPENGFELAADARAVPDARSA